MGETENGFLLELAREAYADGRFEDAERACRGLLADNPDHPDGLVLLGGIQIVRDDNKEAVRILKSATELRPDAVTAWQWLAEALTRLERFHDSVRVLRQALKLEPDNTTLLRMMGRSYMGYGDVNRAAQCFHRCLELDQDVPQALLGLGICFYRDARYGQALDTLLRFVKLDPENLIGRIYLANALLHSGQLLEAEKAFSQLAGLPDGGAPASRGLAAVAVARAQPEEAERHLQDFERLGGDPLVAATIRVRIASLTGADDLARQNLRFMLSRDPRNLDAWAQLVDLGPEHLNQQEVGLLETMAHQLAGKRRARAIFALARIRSYQERLEEEMRALHEANALWSAGHEQETEEKLAALRILEAVCTQDWLNQLPMCWEDDDLRPVFICGMPRSGTTLVEQILSSHPDVAPLGESFAAEAAVRHAAQQLNVTQLEQVLTEAPERLPELIREGYCSFLAEQEGISTGVFTDKSMWLLPYLPLLWKAFPNATFIHVRRHPLDVTFGCYRQLFAGGQMFSYTVKGCASYYAHSEQLMERYKSLLSDRVHELCYESLIADPEKTIESLLDWAGLAWEDDVLDFQNNERVVNTASRQQVSQGLFGHAAGRWRNYGDLLEPFRRALEAEGIDPAAYDHESVEARSE